MRRRNASCGFFMTGPPKRLFKLAARDRSIVLRQLKSKRLADSLDFDRSAAILRGTGAPTPIPYQSQSLLKTYTVTLISKYSVGGGVSNATCPTVSATDSVRVAACNRS